MPAIALTLATVQAPASEGSVAKLQVWSSIELLARAVSPTL